MPHPPILGARRARLRRHDLLVPLIGGAVAERDQDLHGCVGEPERAETPAQHVRPRADCELRESHFLASVLSPARLGPAGRPSHPHLAYGYKLNTLGTKVYHGECSWRCTDGGRPSGTCRSGQLSRRRLRLLRRELPLLADLTLTVRTRARKELPGHDGPEDPKAAKIRRVERTDRRPGGEGASAFRGPRERRVRRGNSSAGGAARSHRDLLAGPG
jgi:ribosomal protein S14